MRKQLGGQRVYLAVGAFVLRQCCWHDERADVELDGALAAVPQRFQLLKFGCERELEIVGQSLRRLWRQRCRSKGRPFQRHGRTKFFVQGVIGRVIGNDGVGIIISAIEEDTDNRLVISRCKSSCFTGCREIERKRRARAKSGNGASALQKCPPVHRVEICHRMRPISG